jgi:hypothetical protein
MESVEAEVRWLSELIKAERHGEHSAGGSVDARDVEVATVTEVPAATAPAATPAKSAKQVKTRKTIDKPRR